MGNKEQGINVTLCCYRKDTKTQRDWETGSELVEALARSRILTVTKNSYPYMLGCHTLVNLRIPKWAHETQIAGFLSH